MNTNCAWCTDPTNDDDFATLCPMHEAEREGLSLVGMDRRDAEWAAEMD